MDDEPSFQVACQSNNPGAKKWYVNVELCYQFWCENGVDCSTCISVCPYNIASAKKGKVAHRNLGRAHKPVHHAVTYQHATIQKA